MKLDFEYFTAREIIVNHQVISPLANNLASGKTGLGEMNANVHIGRGAKPCAPKGVAYKLEICSLNFLSVCSK